MIAKVTGFLATYIYINIGRGIVWLYLQRLSSLMAVHESTVRNSSFLYRDELQRVKVRIDHHS